MHRTLLIASVVIILIGGGLFVYFYLATSPKVTVAPSGSTSLPLAGQQQTSLGTTTVNSTSGGEPSAPVSVSTRLIQISTGPVVPGEALVSLKATDASSSPEVAVSYIERQSGNVFSYLTKTKTLTRTNNKTIPGIQSASWLPDASSAFVQYLSGGDFSTINTYSLAATSSNGFFLPQNLSGVAVASTGLLSLASGVNESIASLSRLDGTHSVNLFTTPLTSLRVSFAGKDQYLAFSKPSGALSGDAFLVSATGSFSRLAGPLNGLVALASPSGKWMLVSFVQNNILQMELINTVTAVVLPLPVATIADKCVWTADDSALYCGIPVNLDLSFTYPDDWYQGVAHFSDRIWKIDIAGRYAQLVLDFSGTTKGSLDATSLAIDQSRTVLVFINKNDGSLWSYSL